MEEDNDEDDKALPGSFFSFTSTHETPDSTATEEVRRKARESILAAKANATMAAPVGPTLPPESGPSGAELPELKEKPFKDWELLKRPRVENEEAEADDADEELEPVFTEETFIPGPEVGDRPSKSVIFHFLFFLTAQTSSSGTRWCRRRFSCRSPSSLRWCQRASSES